MLTSVSNAPYISMFSRHGFMFAIVWHSKSQGLKDELLSFLIQNVIVSNLFDVVINGDQLPVLASFGGGI